MVGTGKVDVNPDDVVFSYPYDILEEDNDDIYAVVELGAEGKPRYLLDKISNFLYTTSSDVRRAENGQYVSRKERGRMESVDQRKGWAAPSTSAPSSNSTSSGGLRKKIAAAMQVMQRYRKAVRIRFRELRDDESSAPSKTTSTSTK